MGTRPAAGQGSPDAGRRLTMTCGAGYTAAMIPAGDDEPTKADRKVATTSPDGWTLSQERQFIEDLLTKRIHFFFIVFAAVIGGAIAARQQAHLLWVLGMGFIVISALGCSVYRANFKLHLILNALRDQGIHPFALIDDECKKLKPVSGFSVRWLIGCWLPLACAVLLFVGMVEAWRGVLVAAPQTSQRVEAVPVAPQAGSSSPSTQAPVTSSTLPVPERWALGIAVAVIGGGAATFPVWWLLHWLATRIGKRRAWKEPTDAVKTPWFPVLIGISERLFFCILIAFAISGVGGAIGAWIAVKFAAGWSRIQTGEPWARMLGFVGLMCSLFSLVFAVLGGLVCNGTLVVW